jgi:hypothetical protein
MRAWLREWLRKTLERFSNGSVAESVMMKKIGDERWGTKSCKQTKKTKMIFIIRIERKSNQEPIPRSERKCLFVKF